MTRTAANQAADRTASIAPPLPFVREARTMLLLSVLTAVALAWIFPPWGAWPLVFVGLAPWAFATCHAGRAWLAHWLTFLVGWGFFLWSLRWLMPVTGLGYAALAFYLAFYWTLAAWAIRTGQRHGISVVWTLPIAWVACEYLRAWVMSGFPWLFLAHALYEQIPLIQISDVTGAYGVSFLAALVNGVLTEAALRRWPRPGERPRTRQLWAGVIVTVVLFVATFVYGAARLSQADFAEPDARGPTVAVVQEDFPQVSTPPYSADSRVVFAAYLVLAAEAAQQRPDLLAFPETAWGAVQNHEFLAVELRAVDEISPVAWNYGKRCDEAISAFARGDYQRVNAILAEFEQQLRRDARAYPERDLPEKLPRIPYAAGPPVPVVVGSMSVEVFPAAAYPKSKRFNSTLVYDPDGTQRHERYDKVHLVPFGEIVPFRYGRLHWLYRWLNSLSPFSSYGKVEYSLTPGTEFTTFTVPYDGRSARFGAPICYEDVMPYVIRGFVWDGTERRVDFLVNISNDGWFLHSQELPQHLAICVFRAVENRVTIARAVNTGASAFIDPNGRIYSRVARDGRTLGPGVVGHDVQPVYIDRRGSMYGRFGDWFAALCLGLAAPLWLDAIIARWVLAIRQRLALFFARRARKGN